jgi:hypothetical protein
MTPWRNPKNKKKNKKDQNPKNKEKDSFSLFYGAKKKLNDWITV